MKRILVMLLLLYLSSQLVAQNKEAGKETIKKYAGTNATIAASSQEKDAEAVSIVLEKYKTAVEKLDVAGTEELFTTDSKIYESGGSEGTYSHYLAHHLIPEFKEFKSFKYDNYKLDVKVDNNYAFATETFNYTIILVKDNSEIKRKGVATSVLKKLQGEWKIWISHNSSRK